MRACRMLRVCGRAGRRLSVPWQRAPARRADARERAFSRFYDRAVPAPPPVNQATRPAARPGRACAVGLRLQLRGVRLQLPAPVVRAVLVLPLAKNRQTKLCDDHTPKHGFASALAVLRQHGNMPWPITSSETHHVLGRFIAGVVREAYAPYFGGYQATPGGPWKSSPLLARATLARCFAWVGIAEE